MGSLKLWMIVGFFFSIVVFPRVIFDYDGLTWESNPQFHSKLILPAKL